MAREHRPILLNGSSVQAAGTALFFSECGLIQVAIAMSDGAKEKPGAIAGLNLVISGLDQAMAPLIQCDSAVLGAAPTLMSAR